MDKRHNNRAARGFDAVTSKPGAATGQTIHATGGHLSPSILPHKRPCFKTQNDSEPLSDALEHELRAYWAAHDRHDYAQADQHAARYRELVHGQREIDARLTRVERGQTALDARLAQLELMGVDDGN